MATELGSPFDTRLTSGLFERLLVISLCVDLKDCVTDCLFETFRPASCLNSLV